MTLDEKKRFSMALMRLANAPDFAALSPVARSFRDLMPGRAGRLSKEEWQRQISAHVRVRAWHEEKEALERKLGVGSARAHEGPRVPRSTQVFDDCYLLEDVAGWIRGAWREADPYLRRLRVVALLGYYVTLRLSPVSRMPESGWEAELHKQRVDEMYHDRFFKLLDHAVACAPKMRICENPDCQQPLYLRSDGGKRFCSKGCQGPTQREYKRRWWERNKGRKLAERKAERKKARRKRPRTSSQTPTGEPTTGGKAGPPRKFWHSSQPR